jgi:hypothetical protein
LQVALEQPVAKRDAEQPRERHRQPQARNRHHHISAEHDHDAGEDRRTIVLRPVCDDSAHQREGVDQEVEHAVDQPRLVLRQVEAGLQEQHQDGHHGVEAEPLTHVREERDDESSRVTFEHADPFRRVTQRAASDGERHARTKRGRDSTSRSGRARRL